MKKAVVQIGAHQYLVAEGDNIEVEGTFGQSGESITINEVLSVVDGEHSILGRPFVKGAEVAAVVGEERRLPKIGVVKFHSKKRYLRHGSQRPRVVSLKISQIKSQTKTK